jgi:hypothetical protein
MFEVDTHPIPPGTFGLRQYDASVFAPENLLIYHIGLWVHLAATYDGTTSATACRLYFNGTEVANGPFSFGEGTSAGLTIGNTCDEAYWPNSLEAFNGDLDEARIYSRALTEVEIAYIAGREPPCDLYSECWECPIIINFKDFAVLADYWLSEDLFP